MNDTSRIGAILALLLAACAGGADTDDVGSSEAAITLEEAIEQGHVVVHDQPVRPFDDFEFDDDFIRNNGGPEAIVWQGFQHQWGYNHRINRLGSSVLSFGCDRDDPDDCRGFVEHTASSGSGSDRATYSTHFTRVISQTDDVRFLNGELRLNLRGEERQTIDIRDTFTLALGPAMADFDRYSVVLNGFDLQAIPSLGNGVTDADKLIDLELGVFNEVYHSAGNTLDFDVEVDFTGSCRSVECNALSRKLDYSLVVRFLVIASRIDPETGLQAAHEITVAPISDSDQWTREDEIFPEPERRTVTGVPGAYDKAFVAIKRLSVALDDEHHLLELDTFVDRVSYDPDRGLVGFETTLFFKQWDLLMNIADSFGCWFLLKPCSYWAFRDDGEYEATAHLRVFQLLEGCTLEGTAEGDFVFRVEEGEVDRDQQLAEFGAICGSPPGDPTLPEPIELSPIDRDNLIDIDDLPDVIVADPLEDARP